MNHKLPKIGLIGYGTMGKEIAKAAKSNGFEIGDIFDVDNLLDPKAEYDFDVALDFSAPSAVVENVKILAEKKKNIVIGVTGWYDDMSLVEKYVKDNNIGLLWGANFSVGMQIFMKLTQIASKFINLTPGYDIFVTEAHHRRKKDSPSGSALVLGDIILKEFQPKKTIHTGDFQGVIPQEVLQISSVRAGEIMGQHSVIIDSPADTIELKHSAKNREGFAAGALIAAAWIHQKKGIFKFEDILDQVWFKED